MKLLKRSELHQFKVNHADARSQIESWEAEVEEAQWDSPHELRKRYPKASIINGRQVVFNICGSRYRLWVTVNYKNKIVLVQKIGSHNEYNKWSIN